MCKPQVWSSIDEVHRSDLELNLLYAISTFYFRRFEFDGDHDKVANPTVRAIINEMIHKDGETFRFAKRARAEYDIFGSALESAKAAIEGALTASIEKDGIKSALNVALTVCTPPGSTSKRL